MLQIEIWNKRRGVLLFLPHFLMLLLLPVLDLELRYLLSAGETLENAYRVLRLLRPASVEKDSDQLVPASAENS